MNEKRIAFSAGKQSIANVCGRLLMNVACWEVLFQRTAPAADTLVPQICRSFKLFSAARSSNPAVTPEQRKSCRLMNDAASAYI